MKKQKIIIKHVLKQSIRHVNTELSICPQNSTIKTIFFSNIVPLTASSHNLNYHQDLILNVSSTIQRHRYVYSIQFGLKLLSSSGQVCRGPYDGPVIISA
jgi:hypothetical protein